MPVLLANYQANIAAEAIKCRMLLEHNQYNINDYIFNAQLVGEEATMSSTSSSTQGTKFKLTTEAVNEATATEASSNTTTTTTAAAAAAVAFHQQQQQQQQHMQMLLLQHQQHQQYLLQQHFAYAGGTNIPQMSSIFPQLPSQPPTIGSTSITTSAQNVNTATETAHFFHDNNFQQIMATITPQQQQHIQQAYNNFYGTMLPQHLKCSPHKTTVNSLPIASMVYDGAALTTAAPTKVDTKPDIEALNDLTARIQQSSSSSASLLLVELNAKLPELAATSTLLTTTTTISTTITTTTATRTTSTSSLTAARVSPVLLAATKTAQSNNIFNVSLDPQYQLQTHQQQEQQLQLQPTKQDHEKQTLLLPHNETAHAIDSSMLPAATNTITTTASSTSSASCEVASRVLTVATPPADTQTLPANCKGG